MSRGKRYDDEQKLNFKKVFAVIIAIIVIIMFFIGIKSILKKDETATSSFTQIEYFSAYENDKWGIINSKGETIIDFAYDEMIIVPDSQKDVFLCMYDVDYTNGTYKTKAINSSNEELFTSYDMVETLSNYSDDEVWYEENVLKVEKDGKYGLINLDGTEILSCEYDEITAIKGVKNSILVKKDELYGLVNCSGSVIIEANYSSIQSLTDSYSDGYIVKNSDGNYGVINSNKEMILDCIYSDIKNVYGNNTYIVKLNGEWEIVNSDDGTNVSFSYDDAKSINNSNIIIKSSSKYGICGIDGTKKVDAEYQDLQYAFLDYYIAKKDNKYGIINSSGEVLVDLEYTELTYNKDADCLLGTKSEDENTYLIDRNLELKLTGTNITVYDGYIRIKIDDEYKFYNLKFEEKTNKDVFSNHTLYVAKNDGKYGLVNSDGTLVVQYEYEDITEQNEFGYVAVKKDGKWGIIDQYGNVVVEPKYEFSNIEDVMVIGKWHSVENVNTVYYVCE